MFVEKKSHKRSKYHNFTLKSEFRWSITNTFMISMDIAMLLLVVYPVALLAMLEEPLIFTD